MRTKLGGSENGSSSGFVVELEVLIRCITER